MLIHLCTSKEFRNKHKTHLVEYYYQQLAEQISLRNVDLNKIISFTELQILCNETLIIILALAPRYLHFVLLPDDIIRDVVANDNTYRHYQETDRTSYPIKAAEENLAYRSRVTEALIDVFEYFKKK